MMLGFPCLRCGRTVHRRAATTKLPVHITCPRCRYMIYDYPRSAAGVVVVKDDTVLLLRRAEPPQVGRVDIPGGFIEAGESIEGAARRELREETGISLGRVTSLGFYWDHYTLGGFGRFPTMNFYFIGRWRRGVPVGGDDAASAEWVPFTQLAALRPKFAWRHMAACLRDARRWARESPAQGTA